MIVDFHVHSTASDGTCAPRELVEQAKAQGFAAIALTDHDNCDGVVEFQSCASLTSGEDAASPVGARGGRSGEDAASPVGVAGVELSIEPGKGFDKFHLLGLGIDPENAGT